MMQTPAGYNDGFNRGHMVNNGRIARLSAVAIWALAGMAATAILVSAPTAAYADMQDDIKDGDDAYADNNWKKASAAYDRAIRNYPKQVAPAVYAKRASIYLIQAADARKKDEALAQKILEDGLKFLTQRAEVSYPSAPEVLEQKALVLWELKSKPDAVKVGEEVVKQKPSAYAVQRILGEFYAVREPERAIKALETYLSERPEALEKGDVLPRINLGFAYLSRAKATRRQDSKGSMALANQAAKQFEILLQRHRKRQHAEVNAQNGLCAAYTFVKEYDKAITVCENVIQNPRNIDRAGSVFYNLGWSYLKKKQTSKARTMGREFVRIRKTEPRGHLLVGETFAEEKQWKKALEEYQKAEEYAKNKSDIAADIGVAMGIAYRRDNNLPLAISKLETAIDLDPDNQTLIIELGNAYLADKQDDKALSRAEGAINAKTFDGQDEKTRVDLLRVAGAAAYNLSHATEKNKKPLDPQQARKHFAAAFAIRPGDVPIRTGLIRTINLQAYRSYSDKDAKKAEVFLGEALEVDKREPMTNQNLAVLRIESGDCDGARDRLANLSKARSYALTYHRLAARTYLCQKKPDKAKAIEHFARAEKAAGNANLVRAEIYTEWAPLIWEKDLDRAVEMLESAVQFTAQDPNLARAANRNLALALFRRGWRDMRAKKATSASEDFARASRDPRVLKGTEAEAFEFSEALARLERGDAATASKLFAKLSKGKQGDYLKAPYDNVGAQFFGAYAKYRSGNAGQQKQAASEFQSLLGSAKGSFGNTVRELLAASYEELAASSYNAGKAKQASSELATAERYASGNAKRNIEHNRAVLSMGSKYSKNAYDAFNRMGSTPPEALANKGVMLDRAGKTKEAYEAWVQARAKGARDRDISNWISAKKRIFGY